MTAAAARFLLALLCGVLVFRAVPAEAHAILVWSDPSLGGQVTGPGVTISLRYNSRIDHLRSRLTLLNPDKTRIVVPISDGTADDVLETKFTVPPGQYVLRWQVLAIDGHITRGDVPFTVTAG